MADYDHARELIDDLQSTLNEMTYRNPEYQDRESSIGDMFHWSLDAMKATVSAHQTDREIRGVSDG